MCLGFGTGMVDNTGKAMADKLIPCCKNCVYLEEKNYGKNECGHPNNSFIRDNSTEVTLIKVRDSDYCCNYLENSMSAMTDHFAKLFKPINYLKGWANNGSGRN